jgi:hypothetical protein
MEREEGGPDAALALMPIGPVRSVVPHRLGRRGRAGRPPQSAEPGAGSAGPGARSNAA